MGIRVSLEGEIINLTPHPLVILEEHPEGEIEGTSENGLSSFSRFRKIAEIPPSGKIARVLQEEVEIGAFLFGKARVPVKKVRYGKVEGLPSPQQGIYYFVSAITARGAKEAGRPTFDLLFPGKLVRNRKGEIVGLESFAQI